MIKPHRPPAPVQVGIVVLNYHHPEETLSCIKSLLARESEAARILWVENDARTTHDHLFEVLAKAPFPWKELDSGQDSLPEAGTVGLILNAENLGYAAGNNIGLRFLHRSKVPFLWVLNNDTLLAAGSSAELVQAAEARPEVGAWGMPILASHAPAYFGATLKLKDFVPRLVFTPEVFDEDPMSYISGCSLFMRAEPAASVGFIPEEYFLYYEDPAFSLLLRRAGFQLGGIWSVVIRHYESLSTGRRSPLMEYYGRRNRWFFIQRFFPEYLAAQKRRIFHTLQKYLLRGKLGTLRVEWAAYKDFKAGRTGPTDRVFHAKHT
jgi:GT2 family glycosyltransferase